MFPNGVIVSYQVHVTEVETDTALISGTITTEVHIANLKPGTAYSVVVFAVTSAGVGNASEMLAVITDLYGTLI